MITILELIFSKSSQYSEEPLRRYFFILTKTLAIEAAAAA